MSVSDTLPAIIREPELHAKWLNSLSLMENTGARKIAASEHPQRVDLIMLKHAAEEARHAYYLKKQLKKVAYDGCATYAFDSLLAPLESYHYLRHLDAGISRYLRKSLKFDGYTLRYAAYLLVTYAIEVRADDLYADYQEALRASGSKVSVRTIIAEEKGHLEEMLQQLQEFFGAWEDHAREATRQEATLFERWFSKVEETVANHTALSSVNPSAPAPVR